MFRLFDALVDGRLLGGVPEGGPLPIGDPTKGGGGIPEVPSAPSVVFARGGAAADAGRTGPFSKVGEVTLPKSDLNGGADSGGGGAVGFREGGVGGREDLLSAGSA